MASLAVGDLPLKSSHDAFVWSVTMLTFTGTHIYTVRAREANATQLTQVAHHTPSPYGHGSFHLEAV